MKNNLTDPFGRKITYLRLSLTDRCDLRCNYCMAEHMVFLPKKDVLSIEEICKLADAFVNRGITKIRLTGGEPLVRKGFMQVINHLSEHLGTGALHELTLTTNATQLSRHADALYKAGIRRINVSLDSLDPLTFNRVTRGGNLARVLEGIEAAQEAGLKIKLNTVALKHDNADAIPDMIAWAHARQMDISLIEIMPLGETGENRLDQFIPLTAIREKLDARWTLKDTDQSTGGPSRYAEVAQTGGRIGFISPLTQNFCQGCNRVRVTCTGKIYLCLGQNEHLDLKAALRGPNSERALSKCIDMAIGQKPLRHDFEIGDNSTPASVTRPMSLTGG
ncbi:MAG TPA: GTP 3',8-cyclase MoaA [Hellea balneolensis]|uniref:GTP 3',8-cyclase n=1 Tax=Hellea balneolensis TaxID=287478 RepID=A0A7C5LYR2_9PROT|nr:GTP 3',8-cyclase MoaA [Hellea balneolensis]